MTELNLDPKKCALVVIDLQKGIVAMPTEPRSAAEVIKNSCRLASTLRAKGGFVVIVRVSSSPDGRDMLKPLSDTPLVGGNRPADWSEIVEGLAPQLGDHLVTKRQWGAFYGTDLDLQLRRRGLSTVIFCGIATNIGVESSARDAYERGYEQVFAEDAMASRSAAEHEHTITRIFPRIGLVRSTADILAAINAG
jgi:nicotinamidase-related amidase